MRQRRAARRHTAGIKPPSSVIHLAEEDFFLRSILCPCHDAVSVLASCESFLYYFFVLPFFPLDFSLPAVYGIAILRQNAQRSGSWDPSCSTVRDCLGYTVRMMRKQFRLKSTSAGRSGAFGCAVTIALNFRPQSPGKSSRQIIEAV